MQTLTLGYLTADLDRDTPGTLRIRLRGRSASRDAGKVLTPLFDQALAAARGAHQALVLHFEKLEYFNSSTIAALVQFIRAAQQAGAQLTIVYDGKAKWQTLSFDALRRALKPFEGPEGQGVRFTVADSD